MYSQPLHPGSRLISTPRMPSALWQSWIKARGIQSVSATDLVPKGHRLVVVAPHPDDEVLACGALIHQHVASGGTCLVVAVTDGEASHLGSAGYDPKNLALQRQEESTAGLRQLGISGDSIVRLRLPDGGLQARVSELKDRVQALLCADDVVCTTWRRDGHPDHEACGYACANACLSLGVSLLEAPVWMWHWANPLDPQVDWTRLCGMRLDSQTVARKRLALDEHRSQLTERSPTLPAVLDTALVERAEWPVEYFFFTQ